MSKFGACVDSTLTWIGNNKLSSFLIVCLFAFIVSTWTLAAINADLKRRLHDAENQDTTTTTEQPKDTTTTEPPKETSPTITETATTTTVVTTPESQVEKHARRRRYA